MKDGKFEKGDRLECVEEIGNLRKGKIYICSGYSGVYDNITLEDKDGGFFYRRFKLAKLEPAPFIPEYFSALNEKDGEKYIGKVVEFADRKGLKHFEWEKGTFININHEANTYSFKSLNSSGFQFMRTCPETHAPEIKKPDPELIKALELSVQQWQIITDIGKSKGEAYKFLGGGGGEGGADCFLCDYAFGSNHACPECINWGCGSGRCVGHGDYSMTCYELYQLNKSIGTALNVLNFLKQNLKDLKGEK